MAWKKIENEAGYPCYFDEIRGVQQYDHPSFFKVKDAIDEFNKIENNLYRIAFKVFTLKNCHKVPSLRICSGVFARHQLSLSEASLSLDAVELEAVLSDIYFAAEKAGQFSGDKDIVVDLLINFILNVFDRDRKEPLKVQAVKTVLILLSAESATNKWLALANCASDHNGCVSPRRLGFLLNHVVDFLTYLGHTNNTVTSDVELCFNKNGGMLGATAQTVAEWGLHNCTTTSWLPILHRIQDSRQVKDNILIINCSSCNQTMTQTLLFKCVKCIEIYFCESCYLFNKHVETNGHKETHVVQEITDEEMLSQHQTGFIEGMRRFFFCTKTKKKHITKSKSNKKDSNDKKVNKAKLKDSKENKPAIFTSTVGKASGNNANNAASVLQDIINKLESQNRALQELSDQMQVSKDLDVGLQTKVNTHWNMISLEINRLKMLKENLQSTPEPAVDQKHDKAERPQAFDLFSPIPMVAESKVTDHLPNPPRILSMDSGNFSVMTKHTDSQNLLTVSGDALKPVTRSTTNDTISHVSMGDISDWYHETESLAPDKTRNITQYPRRVQGDLSLLTTERKYAADIRTVETSNDKMKELNADLDTVLDRLQEILTNNFAVDDSCFDNNQLRETANEMEGLLGSLIRGVEKRATLNQTKTMV